MKKMLISALVAASMTCACATVSPPSPSAIERADAAYDRIATSVEMFVLPLLPAAKASRIRELMAIADQALVKARTAATIVEQFAALKQAEQATAAIGTAAASDR